MESVLFLFDLLTAHEPACCAAARRRYTAQRAVFYQDDSWKKPSFEFSHAS